MLCLYRLRQNCLQLTLKEYLSSKTYTCKYEKLPNIVIHACKNIAEKMIFLQMCGPQIRLCLFTFRPIASKQLIAWLKSLLLVDSGMREVSGSIPGSGNDFLCLIVLPLLCFYFFVQKHIICHKILQFFFAMLIYLV